MTTWQITSGDILDVDADVLVCSANPFLTLSGGVGGAFLLRYGSAMQEFLQAHLDQLGVRHVPRGTVVQARACGSTFRAVLHAVAVDGMYESSPDVITDVLETAIKLADKRVAERSRFPRSRPATASSPRRSSPRVFGHCCSWIAQSSASSSVCDANTMPGFCDSISPGSESRSHERRWQRVIPSPRRGAR
jgi:hypothetical protein